MSCQLKFKVGDRIRILDDFYFLVGKIGTIININGDINPFPILVQFDIPSNGETERFYHEGLIEHAIPLEVLELEIYKAFNNVKDVNDN